MKKIWMFTIGGVFLTVLCFAQNEIDALRYSQLNYSGTARFTSMSGAFGALGGDFSTLSTNPAGIGIYRKSEFTFTPSFFIQGTTSNYKGSSLYDYKTNVNSSNAGIVLSYYSPETKSAWKGAAFGVGYNRLNNFHNRISMSGKNTSNSLLDIYVNDIVASGGDTSAMDPFGTQLALNSNAVWIDSLGYVYHHLQGVYGQEQTKEITTSGAMGETVFTFGGNYNDKLFLGGTLGVPHIRYNEESTYKETGDTNALNNFKYFELNQDVRTRGTGFNFKFGMIYKPADWVRIGGSIHTPSFFNMSDAWSSDMSTNVIGTTYKSESPSGSFDYSLSTPMRALGSLGFVINKMGLIGIDYEFVDYPSARLRSSDYKFLNENKNIRAKYKAGNNLRIGTEWRIQPISIRVGFAYYESPFKREVDNDGSRIDYTAGIGFRDETFFLDFAYVLSMTSENYYFYDAAMISPFENDFQSSKFLVTLGFKF